MDGSSFRRYLILAVFLLLAVALLTAFSLPDNNLHIIACDVGQGDAILFVRGSDEILIDGGPDNSVLNCLGRHLPFWDRKIEMVILTHPQADHYTGLIEVMRRFEVGIFLVNAVNNDTRGYRLLKNEVGSRGIMVVNPFAGQRLRLGLIYLDVVNPPRELANPQNPGKLGEFTTKRDLNDFSIVALIRFGNFKGLFTGDIGESMKTAVITTGLLEDVDYIKIAHHGSRTGLTNFILDITRPEVGVISVGKNNKYGHPSKETLEILKNYGVKILRTDEKGDVEIVTDGENWWAY